VKKFSSIVLVALFAGLLGGLIGTVSIEFLQFIEWGEQLLWHVLTIGLPLQALLICTLGGLLVGLCQRFLGDYPKNITEEIATIRKTGRMSYQHLPQGMTNAAISLIFGASLGREAIIVDLVGGLSTWASDSIGRLRQRIGQAHFATSTDRLRQLMQHWPHLIALAVGLFAFYRGLDGLYSDSMLKLSQPFQWVDLFWCMPVALFGAAGGGLFLGLQSWMRNWVAPLRSYPILRAMLGGFTLGLVALFLPNVLFSGQHDLQPMYDQAAQLGFGVLLLIALARLFLTSLLLATGWKGGPFLPIMFGGAALGLSLNVLFPTIPPAVAAIGAMGALVAVVMPNPLLAIIFVAVMIPWQYVGISIVTIGIGVLTRWLWRLGRGVAVNRSISFSRHGSHHNWPY
jgi:H+/Cl- antiporter ClcA